MDEGRRDSSAALEASFAEPGPEVEPLAAPPAEIPPTAQTPPPAEPVYEPPPPAAEQPPGRPPGVDTGRFVAPRDVSPEYTVPLQAVSLELLRALAPPPAPPVEEPKGPEPSVEALPAEPEAAPGRAEPHAAARRRRGRRPALARPEPDGRGLPGRGGRGPECGGEEGPAPGEGRHHVRPGYRCWLGPVFEGRQREPHAALCWEHEGNRAARQGKWKRVSPFETGSAWELYEIEADRTEMNNLAAGEPARAKELSAVWDAWAARVGVQPWEQGKAKQKKA